MAGTKFDSNKPDLSLIPYCSEVAEAEALMIGEKKYGRYNFEDGHKASQLAAAIKRHLGKWINGEERDPDGQHHLGAIKANCSMLLRQIELGTLIDDRSKNKGSKKDIEYFIMDTDGSKVKVDPNEVVVDTSIPIKINLSNATFLPEHDLDWQRRKDSYEPLLTAETVSAGDTGYGHWDKASSLLFGDLDQAGNEEE